MEKPNYFKLVLRDKTVYFIISHIKKYNVYSLHGKDFYDYQIVIKDIYQKNNSEPFEEKYSGLLLCVDNKKNICIYDNIKKKYIDIEKTDDLHHVSYYYGANMNYFSLENTIKEILLSIFLSENC
jgi:hypothetical protein